MLQTCFSDDACNFMYECRKGTCTHKDVFPLQIYPFLVYLLIPIACGLCNLTGNSMGMFKIMILMNLLRYNIGDATAIIQALVVGTAFPNFFSIIFQSHPNKKTSLVNFNLIMVFIPCSLYGSTLGALLQSFLPQLIQDILIFLMFTYFSISFIRKIKVQLKLSASQQKRQSLLTIQDRRESYMNQNNIQSEMSTEKIEIDQRSNDGSIKQKSISTQNLQNNSYQLIKQNQQIPKTQNINSLQTIKINKPKKGKKKKSKDPQIVNLRQQIKKYQKSIHLKHILISFAIFLVFEILAFFAQGKIPYLQFSKCSVFYPIGLGFLTAAVVTYLFFIKGHLNQVFSDYKKVKYKAQIDLSDVQSFRKIVLGAFTAGFIQGTIGVGAGTFLMLVLLGFPIDPRAAAATTGYQILFTGSGALVQQFINSKITWQTALFFFCWTAIIGGIVTDIMYNISRKLDDKKVKKILLLIISVLCILSLILIFPVSIQRIIEEGWAYMIEGHFQC